MAGTGSSAVSSGSSVYGVSEEKTNGTRLVRLLIDEGTHVLREFLYSIHPAATLQQALINNRGKLKRLRSKRVLFDSQWEKLFPSSGNPPDSNVFDITLLHLLLREICNLTAPSTGWHKMPADADASPEASIVRIKCYRNELCHGVSTGIPNDEFEDKWNKISSSLEALEVIAYRKKLRSLKNAAIDHDTRRVEEELEQWRKEKQLEKSGLISELCTCLPDDIPEELIFGRSQQVQEVKEKVQSGTVPVVLITGGPGFGKTTVAKRVSYELAKPGNKRTVLFCSLLSKATFNEVATEMINSCGTVHTQVPENPEQWLKNWGKQIQTQVTFVLDNADDILDSDDRKSFLRVLCAVRMQSKKNVTYVITTRKTFQDPNMQTSEVRLNPVSNEEAKKILVSRVHDQEVRKKLSETEKLVELCDCVPLALCIVGPLLSDYPEEKLIKTLEEEPLKVLEDDQISLEKAIKASFDLLTNVEQDAFVLMSVFPGPFNSDAAEAVMGDCLTSGTLPISIIRSLKNRSLVEQPSTHRYQLHSLIKAFAKKIGRAELLAEGEQSACSHYMSRFVENANKFWKKDHCKESIQSFNEDRSNFEHFLKVYIQRRKNQDQEVLNKCETFLDDLPQKCMYLEMCVLPEFYLSTLEGLLETYDPKSQPLYRVELLCLLGHVSRKRDRQKYERIMEEADQIHSKNFTEFKRRPFSEVYFRNSYVRFLSDKKDPNNNERIQRDTDIALKVSKEQLGDHPETAATLLYAGILEKRRKNRGEAEQKLRQASELFKKCLGKHFMTAESLKAMADLDFFFDTKAKASLGTSLKLYSEAITMLEDLGMGDSKESILALKNCAMCHMRKKNFGEAKNLLRKAEQIAERELEADSTRKVSTVKTALAILYDKMEKPEQAKELMKEGLLMAKRIPVAIDEMGDKDDIREFLNRYPETFPEKEFPRK